MKLSKAWRNGYISAVITVREMSHGQRGEWLRMRCALWPECTPERHALETKQMDASSGVVLIAAETSAACGFAEISVRHDHVDGTATSPVAYLEAWYVDAGVRGQGVGRALLAAVEDWARAQGFRELASDAELDEHDSITAHLSCGFREVARAVHFVKPLAPTEAHDLQP